MRATPWPEGCTAAPLLWQSQLSETYSTIHDVPTSSLSNQAELALVLLMDHPRKQLLLQVPDTQLGWRFHFGCVMEESSSIISAMLKQNHGIAVQSLRTAGTMLFSFPRPHEPLRVQVLEACVDSSTTTTCGGGTWTKLDEIPYTDMWADDILWLPWFVESSGGGAQTQVQLEGHFLFDGPPGPTSLLVAHNCQRLDIAVVVEGCDSAKPTDM